MTATIHVDFNDLVRGGQVLGYLDQVDGEIAVGDEVVAVDDAEGLTFGATVGAIEDDEVYLLMHWRTRQSSDEVAMDFAAVAKPHGLGVVNQGWVVSWNTPSRSPLLGDYGSELHEHPFDRRVVTRNEHLSFAGSSLS
ncbi:hypothetical protein [Blastococcus capsensis]|uniref:hypothetical protein n=1 Tax=Blastococcus capsensis TaxID=1564163 RepID=UPI002540D785|nr:hypothetical protein [Blastococcus capsensis]MDK3256190.1 hypothetical protein [Blastococcus capsensis]